MSKSTTTKEYLVRVPKTEKTRLSILKFNESLNVKPQQWTGELLQMEREDNRRHGLSIAGEVSQEYGEGSEYGKAARDEARRKKYGRQSRKYEHDKQPWRLEIGRDKAAEEANPEEEGEEKGGTGGSAVPAATTKARKFRSIREAGAGEHADYWVFHKSGNDLEAHKVDEWYQFLPAVTYKYLDAEQAEERYKEMDKVHNQFVLKTQIQRQLAEQEEQQKETMRKSTSRLKIKDEASSEDEEKAGEGENGPEMEGNRGKKTKKAKEKPKRAKKKQRVENADQVAAYESDDGDDEGREYDYMSDSGSDTDREELNTEKKMDEDLVGVADEKGLKGDLESDEEEEEQEEEGEEEAAEEEEPGRGEEQGEEAEEKFGERGEVRSSKAVRNVEKIMAQKGGSRIAMEVEEKDSSGSDTEEDPDSREVKSVLFMQDKRKKQLQSQPAAGTSQQRKRRAEEEAEATGQPSGAEDGDAKRPKLSQEDYSEVISEAFVRRLLDKKPHSTKQLLAKINQRLQQLHGGETAKDKKLVAQLADILRNIGPYQFRKKNEAGKEVLFFSTNRTA